MARRRENPMSFESVIAIAGLLLAVAIGAWWTGAAVAEGQINQTMLRFGLSVAGGCYYLVLYRIARYSTHHPSRRFP